MKFNHLPFSYTYSGKLFYLNQSYALKLARKLGKTARRTLIPVPYTNWDMRIDPYTGKKTVQCNTDGEPKKLSTKIVNVYGYYLVDKIEGPSCRAFDNIDYHHSVSRYNLRSE
jgi:hypothetical protein